MNRTEDLLLRRKLEDIYLKVSTNPLLENNPHFSRHLRRGLGRRLGLIGRNYQFLIDRLRENGKKPLVGTFSSDVQIHLNSFYIHLRGALDNLAWLYIFRHFAEASEDQKKFQNMAHLFSKDFLGLAREKDFEIYRILSDRVEWNAKIKNYRDPIVHRIPMYSSPAFWTNEEAERYEELQKITYDAISASDFDFAEKLREERQCIGTYHPNIANETGGGFGCQDLFSAIHEDLAQLLGIVETFIPYYVKVLPSVGGDSTQ
jgi:hypothetical protein